MTSILSVNSPISLLLFPFLLFLLLWTLWLLQREHIVVIFICRRVLSHWVLAFFLRRNHILRLVWFLLYAKSIIHFIFIVAFFGWLHIFILLFSWILRIAISACLLGFIVLRPTLSRYLKSFYLRFVKVNFGWLLEQVLVPSQEDLRKRTPKVSAIKIGSCLYATSTSVSLWFYLLNHVDLITLRTENLDATVS